ncbi:hypothetical protein Q5762_27615 [Streptomyces sp. P9(2023)]|uniref:hypothetical protein n=1 Tax=Streptomyces sp. P9(2023) TaxID=3064394 RepID=UPI0028F40F84|nr:hypothetical protein [Streptomyces sp. P9(2023)]MDT9692032.1 hypothetical protein [Streptomyces sp. P9(2023)]
MNEDLRNVVLGVLATGVSASLGWLTRTYLSRRKLRRKQAFFGLRDGSECLLVVNRKAGSEGSVHRVDVSALLELSALIKDCGALPQIVQHDAIRQGLGDRTEFCVGGPSSNRRMAAHLSSLLPGLTMSIEPEPGENRGLVTVGGEVYRAEWGVTEYVALARLTGGDGGRPVFLFCGQSAITNQAATRYLARHHEKLARKYDSSPFVLLLKVVNSDAYGPDVVELVADVTSAARTAPAPEPAAS